MDQYFLKNTESCIKKWNLKPLVSKGVPGRQSGLSVGKTCYKQPTWKENNPKFFRLQPISVERKKRLKDHKLPDLV
jgi:hypothetical protein